IEEPAGLELSCSADSALCNGEASGSVKVEVQGGTGMYTYTWTDAQDNPVGSTAMVSNLPAGTYKVVVMDENECTDSCTAVIEEPAGLELSCSADSALCNGESSGSVKVEVQGGTGMYTYAWTDAQDNPVGSTAMVSNLPAGTYKVVVMDENECTDSCTAIIEEPAGLELSCSADSALCNGEASGSVKVEVQGGTGMYTYAWTDAQDNPVGSTAMVSNLPAGTYKVVVMDENDCTDSCTAIIEDPAALELSCSADSALCNGEASGSVKVEVQGGTGMYTYAWTDAQDNPVGSTAMVSNLPAGTYKVVVMDENECTDSCTAVIEEPAALELSCSADSALCNGESSGSVKVEVQGGTGMYTYAWTDAQDNPVGSTAMVSNLPAGTYKVVVMDENDCTDSCTAIIEDPAALELSCSADSALCNGEASGSVKVEVQGGTGMYTYAWTDAQDNPVGSTAMVSNLPAGTYKVVVMDENDCTDSCTAIIEEPAGLELSCSADSALCNGEASGSVKVEVQGGTGMYTYAWTDAQDNPVGSTAMVSNLPAGTYKVVVMDENDCTDSCTAVIEEPTAIVIESQAIDALCNGDLGAITGSLTGGTPPYKIQATNGIIDTTFFDVNPGMIGPIPLPAGTYMVTVTDANGCIAMAEETISEPTPLEIACESTPVPCTGDSTGTVTVTFSGGTEGYFIQFENEDASIVIDTSAVAAGQVIFQNLPAGKYKVFVTDNNECEKMCETEITEPDEAVSLTIEKLSDNIVPGVPDGSFKFTLSGGTPNYMVTITGALDTVFNDLEPGEYIVEDLDPGFYFIQTVDANGCVDEDLLQILESTTPPPSLTAVATPVPCKGESTGSISGEGSGGFPPYTIELTKPDMTTETLTGVEGAFEFLNLPAGVYQIKLTDSEGLTNNISVEITEPETAVSVTASSTDATAPGASDGSVSAMASGGTPFMMMEGGARMAEVEAAPVEGYIYIWTNSEGETVGTTSTVEGVPAGTYKVTATDANECTAMATVVVEEPRFIPCPEVRLLANPKITNESYRNAFDGAIDVTITGGNEPYTYFWTGPNGFTATTEDIEGLTMGRYTLKVVDANGCEGYFTYYLRVDRDESERGDCEGVRITAKVKQSDESYRGARDGFIIVDLQGGQAPYQYYWMGPDGFNSDTNEARNLTAGQYTLKVKDANGCTGYFTYFMRVDGERMENSCDRSRIYANVVDMRHADDDQARNGSISIMVTGGTAPYQYSWSGPNGYEAYNTPLVKDLEPGAYEVTVADRNGCVATFTYMVKNMTCEYFSYARFIVKDASTIESEDGEITMSEVEGEVAYSYEWRGPDGFTSSARDLSDLKPGIYNLTVLNARGCSSEFEFNLGVERNVLSITEQLKVYPNPSEGFFTLELPTEFVDSHIEIYNAAGQLVHTLDANGVSQNQIDMRTYGKGMYILKAVNDHKVLTEKLIIR
ncbi:T9SS type A sorting domain-containing protein, partial [Algivirga pacifica]|uniref:T9SS type A sorting domain-containing protein n=1 Tax=Algivirga pacifica TaxID=1162670 RepID=UPI0031E61333